MALLFDSNGERVDHGSATSLDDVFTGFLLCAIRPTDLTTAVGPMTIIAKGNNVNYSLWIDTWDGSLIFQIFRATTSLLLSATPAQLGSHWAGNKWLFVGLTWSTGGVNADQKIFTGDPSTPLVEPSAYSSQAVGSGTPTSTAADNLTVGGRSGNNTYFNGRIGHLIFGNVQKPLNELRTLQWNPRLIDGSVKLFSIYGFGGTGSQADWSGTGNSGTVTGATVSDHVPVGHFFSLGDKQVGLFQNTIKTYTPTGGVVLGGSATLAKTKAFLPTGGVVLGGSATLSKTKNYLPGGGIVFGGDGITSGAGSLVSRIKLLLGVGH